MNKNKQNFYYLFPTLIGKNIIIFITSIGNITSFLIYALYKAVIPPFYIKEYVKQIYNWMGIITVVALTAFFTGGAIALQIYSGGTRLNAESAVPSIVAIGF